MSEIVEPILISANDLGVQVIKAADEATIFKKECDEVKIKVQKLLELLEKTFNASSNLCEFPTHYVISKAETVLHKSLSLFNKCTPKLRNRVLLIVRVSTFPKMLTGLERSISDVLWLLKVSTPREDGERELLGLPASAMNDPILFMVYELMAILYTGTTDESCEAATSMRTLASENPRYAEIMIRNGLCSVFVKILKHGSMRAQAEVACTISVLVESFPESQNVFAQYDVIQLLLSLLVAGKTPELEGSSHVKAMAAKALRELAKGNSTICKSITDSKRFLRFADLIQIEDREVTYNSVMILLEITAVAEQNYGLRRSAFNFKSLVFKAIVNQIHKLIEENGDTVLLIPYIRLIGSLARAFRASDTLMVEKLVKLLGHQDSKVLKEAVVAVTKFVTPCNYLHKDHSKAVVEAGGARKLVDLCYLGCEIRIPALELLLCIALDVPDNEEVIKALEWTPKS